jgi:hypothetical protein
MEVKVRVWSVRAVRRGGGAVEAVDAGGFAEDAVGVGGFGDRAAVDRGSDLMTATGTATGGDSNHPRRPTSLALQHRFHGAQGPQSN